MTIRYVKRGKVENDRASDDAAVRTTVEAILKDTEVRGDAAVRELSKRFDEYSPSSFHLSPSDIKALVSKVSNRVLKVIRFAQVQAGNFARTQRHPL